MINKIIRWNSSIFLPEHQCLPAGFNHRQATFCVWQNAKLEYLECNPYSKKLTRRNQAARIKQPFFAWWSLTITAALTLRYFWLFKDAFLFVSHLGYTWRGHVASTWGARSQLVVKMRDRGMRDVRRQSHPNVCDRNEPRWARWQNVSNIHERIRAPINNITLLGVCCARWRCTLDGCGQTVSTPPALVWILVRRI